ncbi:hypothetical protein ACHAWF_003421 [Thalassiosira exigua]
MAMLLYGVTLLPLLERVRAEVPEVMSLAYVNVVSLMGPVGPLTCAMGIFRDKGPQVSYYLEDDKSWAVCPRVQEEELKGVFEGAGLWVKFTRGHRLVGGFVGSEAMADRWVKPQV